MNPLSGSAERRTAAPPPVAGFPPDFRLLTPRLTLRPPAEGDLAGIVRDIGDPGVARMLSEVPHPYRMVHATAWLGQSRRAHAAGSDLALVIEEDGRVVGGIGLHRLPVVRNFGYWLARAAWGRGLATEAAGAVLAFAFGRLGVERVPSGVFSDNPASLRVQQKLGFETVGRSRVFCLARGRAVDHIDTLLVKARFLGPVA